MFVSSINSDELQAVQGTEHRDWYTTAVQVISATALIVLIVVDDVVVIITSTVSVKS